VRYFWSAVTGYRFGIASKSGNLLPHSKIEIRSEIHSCATAPRSVTIVCMKVEQTPPQALTKTRFVEAVRLKLSAATITKSVILLVTALLLLFQLPASFIEQFYANGFYPRLQSLVTPLTNLLPVALYDVLLVSVVVGIPLWWFWRLKKAERGTKLRALLQLAINTIILAAAIFLLFLAFWGFNYSRIPLTAKLDYDNQRINEENALKLYRLSIEQLNREVEAAHQTALPDDAEWRRRLQPAYNALLQEFGRTGDITLARAKTTLFDRYLEATGISGFINPYGLETVVGRGYHPLTRAFTLAHEWGHLAGYATESEASFIGLLALLRSEDAAARYAGWLELYRNIPFTPEQRERLKPIFAAMPQLSEAVKADLRAMAEEAKKRRLSPKISEAQWQMYEQFLKANNARPNYNELISLVMGTEFDAGWKPQQRVR